MKGWQIAALVVGLVLVGIVAFKKVAPAKAATKTVTTPGASNDLFASLISLGAAVGSKITAPSGKSPTTQLNQGTYTDIGKAGAYYDPSSGVTDVIEKDTIPDFA